MPLLTTLLPFLSSLITRLIPDKTAQAAAQLQLQQLAASQDAAQLNADLQVALAQAATNTAEAAGNWFKSGWRPFIGWVCGLAFAYNFLILPLLAWSSSAWWHVSIPPVLDLSQMMPVLLGMLGLGTLRTVERVNGVIPKGS